MLRDVFAVCPYDVRPGAGGSVGFEVANDYGLAAGEQLEVFVGHYENQDYTSVGMATVSDDGATLGMDGGLGRLTWLLLADPGASMPDTPEDDETEITSTVEAQLLLDNGQPASGFFTTFCSAETCLTGTSDEEGMVSFSPTLGVHWVLDAVGQKDHPDGAYSTFIMPVRPTNGDSIDLGSLRLPLCGAHLPVN